MIRCRCGSRKVVVKRMCKTCYMREYRATHPEFRERQRLRCLEYMRKRATRMQVAPVYGPELVRVPVKGWGVRHER